MDDYGNLYQTEEWMYGCEQYAYSMNTFGMFDATSEGICWDYMIDYAAQDI